MLYRAAMVLVVVFWAAMWAMLIRSELRPEDTGLREVPPELVLRQVFQQGQTSDLILRTRGSRSGQFRFTPKLDAESGARSIDLLGSFPLEIPGVPQNHHASWQATLELDAELALQRLRGSVTIRPSGFRSTPLSTLQLSMELPEKRGHYRLGFGNDEPTESDFTIDEAGLQKLLQQWGVDPALTKSLSPRGITVAPQVTARLARFNTHNEQLETYLVTVRNEGQTLLEMHVSQLGQIIHARTLIGWEFAAE